jgi:phosphatidylserine/phosphatidylglycerophosphate/cardiolipin synthase-like enzyme
VNELIDNAIAMRARRDVYESPNINRVFHSTYILNEDTIGYTQIKLAIDQAKRGIKVDMLLDDAGHGLSDETLLYLAENKVNVHLFSPKFSWEGFKSRLQETKKTSLPFIAYVTALWRQVTHRMHDKILINFDKTNTDGGYVIVGGRNGNNSHYGLETKIETANSLSPSGKQLTTLVPTFEFEHEVLIHNKNFHKAVTRYVGKILNSKFTEPLDVEKLRKKKIFATKMLARMRGTWREKVLIKGPYNYDKLIVVRDELEQWIKHYQYSASLSDPDYPQLAKDLSDIFNNHEKSIAMLIDEGLLNPRFLNKILEPIYGKQISEIIKTASSNGLETSSAKGAKLADMFSYLLEKNIKSIAQNLKIKALKSKHISMSLISLKKLKISTTAKLRKIFNSFIQRSNFDLEKYGNMKKILSFYEKKYKIHEYKKPINWKSTAHEVDKVSFLHDRIDGNRLKKKSMTDFYEEISKCRGDCIWNSQYGSLTENALEAIDTVVRKNSAIYRFTKLHFNEELKLESSKKVTSMLLILFKSNISYMQEALTNEHIPHGQLKIDILKIQRNMSLLLDGNKEAQNQLSELTESAIRRKSPLRMDTIPSKKIFLEKSIQLLRKNKDLIASNIFNNQKHIKESLLNFRGFLDHDPLNILPPFKKINFYFMSNDVNSWSNSADKVTQADFHNKIMTKLRKMGPGLHVIGFNKGGKIHSKVFAGNNSIIVGSMNADPRSEFINSEVAVKIVTKVKGRELNKMFTDNLHSYMDGQRHHIKDGKLSRPKQCFDVLTRIARRILEPIL